MLCRVYLAAKLHDLLVQLDVRNLQRLLSQLARETLLRTALKT